MNLDALNGLIKSITSTYKCPSCTNGVGSKDVHIKNINGNSILIDVVCPNCKNSSLIKSEVISVDLNKLNLSEEQLSLIRKGIDNSNTGKISSHLGKSENIINDGVIVELNKDLKKDKLSVSELFSSLEN